MDQLISTYERLLKEAGFTEAARVAKKMGKRFDATSIRKRILILNKVIAKKPLPIVKI